MTDEHVKAEDIAEKQVESGTLDEEGSRTVAQQNVGRPMAAGGGEWPEPDAAPRGPAPGTAGGAAGATPRSGEADPDVLKRADEGPRPADPPLKDAQERADRAEP